MPNYILHKRIILYHYIYRFLAILIMEISFRLSCIAKKVTQNSILADIGTDHAYIPIFLCKHNIIKKALACDISKLCLKKAYNNIKNNNLTKSIETRLSNGLDNIYLKDNINSIIIAGMGGMLIIDILKRGINIANNADTLILQPQKNIKEVRIFLHQNNFYIIDEDFIQEDNKFYNIIVAKKGSQKFNELEYTFGKHNLNKQSPVFKQYILKELSLIKNILSNKKINSLKEIEKLNNKKLMLEEVLKCL